MDPSSSKENDKLTSYGLSSSSSECPEVEQLIGASERVFVRRVSCTAPSSPQECRKKRTKALLPSHNIGYMSQLQQIIMQSFWGLPDAHSKHSESLHRSESMVSLSCFKTLTGLVTDDNLSGLETFLAANKNATIDDKDENGTTALMLACELGRTAAARALLAAGADPGAQDSDGWSPLAHCAKTGQLEIARELLDRGASVDPRDMGGWTPLMWASYKGHEEVVGLLIEHGADVNAHGNYNISSLVWAAGRRHSGVVRRLLAAGARATSCDKYGTSALTWAARAGDAVSVAALLTAGAHVDTAGMYCWTPLLQAAKCNHYEIVQMLLEHKANVNASDKDGNTALMIACKDGYYDIAVALLNAGAYINIQDHSKDTCLIHAVKGGHKPIVEALLKKHVDVDGQGKDRKTAVYTAVEKGHVAILKILLQANPDLEVVTKSGDTALLRAVKCRNAEIVQMLLDKKARVAVTDRRGDTVLHIAMRARSKQIVEILLRNPKNSQLLYKPNKAKETPYNIDMSYPKTILGQIFGARKLNTSEDSERLLGYELYSAALADMLAGPELTVPITVGLYARWGSGKSFLLTKLKEEMKNFALAWCWESGSMRAGWAGWWGAVHAALVCGAVLAAAGTPLHIAAAIAASLLAVAVLLYLITDRTSRYELYWPNSIMAALNTKLNSLKLILQILFCHPPGPQCSHSLPSQPIRFQFTEQTKSGSQEGEATVVHALASLAEGLEVQHGRLALRLARALHPAPVHSTATWRWRRACCIPYIISFEFILLCALLGFVVLVLYLTEQDAGEERKRIQEGILIGTGGAVGVALLANLYKCGRVILALLLSPAQHVRRAARARGAGLLHALRPELRLLRHAVSCLDAFTGSRTRLVVCVDALDACEQERVLALLDALHALCCEHNAPFLLILAIDPHIISKAVEVNSRRQFSESNIGGWDYLRNMVHLPFYLQNSALRKVKVAQQTAVKRMQMLINNDEYASQLQRSVSTRRLSVTSATEGMSSQERLRSGSTRRRAGESLASSVASGLHRLGGPPAPAADLSRVLLNDDYFSDVNPRSMRRLMNVLYITGRLLKAFQIEFNWYQLASWVNLTEQWPFRTSWIIYHQDMVAEHIEDTVSLKHIYDKIKPQIPTMKGTEPLMDLDRDERKLEAFLNFHRSSLLVADLKIFLPFTINLDPYIKKVIKEEQQQAGGDAENAGIIPTSQPTASNLGKSTKYYHKRQFQRQLSSGVPMVTVAESSPTTNMPSSTINPTPSNNYPLLGDLTGTRLSTLSVEEVCQRLAASLPSVAANAKDRLHKENICGMVLAHCELNELKMVLNLPFGDWELFKMWVTALREIELELPLLTPLVNVVPASRSETDSNRSNTERRPSVLEKQVTLEEQMICGALQTLSEEADNAPEAEDDESEIDVVLLKKSPTASSLLVPPRIPTHTRHDTFQFENELEPSDQLTLNIDRKHRGEGSSAEYKKYAIEQKKTPLVENRNETHSAMYDQNSKHNNLQWQGKDIKKKEKGLLDTGSTAAPRRSRSVGHPRPSSLHMRYEDDKPQESKISKIKKPVDILRSVSSVERLSKLKEKFIQKSLTPERSVEKVESDDESTPLVSSEKSSSGTQNADSPDTSKAKADSSSSSSPSPQHSKSTNGSSKKRSFPMKSFGCSDIHPDTTVSSEFSPVSDNSSLCSPSYEIEPDMLPEEKGQVSRKDVPSSKDRLKQTDSEEPLSNMLEPYNMPLINSAISDSSLKICLWRQDAVEDDWNSPESAV